MYWDSLILTIAAETSVACLWNYFDHRKHQYWLVIATVIGLNLITHPIAWSVYEVLPGAFLSIEAIVVFAETLGLIWILGMAPKSAVKLGMLMNVVTIFISFLPVQGLS